jgi:hypothetical protein
MSGKKEAPIAYGGFFVRYEAKVWDEITPLE